MLLPYSIFVGVMYLLIASLETAETLLPGILSFQPLRNPIHWTIGVAGILVATMNDVWRRRFARVSGAVAVILFVMLAVVMAGIKVPYASFEPASETDRLILAISYLVTAIAGLVVGCKKDRPETTKLPHSV